MKRIYGARYLSLSFIVGLFLVLLCTPIFSISQTTFHTLASPRGKTKVTFQLNDHKATYSVDFNGKAVLREGTLGYVFKGSDSLTQFQLIHTEEKQLHEKWKPVWGQTDSIENSYHELKVILAEIHTNRKLIIHFRAYDDGFAFHYEIPKQKGVKTIEVIDEMSTFSLTAVNRCWWSWADYNTLEKNYYETSLDSTSHVAVPFTYQHEAGFFVSIHEAAIEDYSTLTLKKIAKTSDSFEVDLVPWLDGTLVKTQSKMTSPWRSFLFAENAGELMTSNLIQNLNSPSKINNVSWIQPMNYCGIWWEMHLGISSWKEGANHGTTTENAKRYIDFAADNGIKGFLMEGWNKGWENWGKKNAFDFLSPAADLNLKEVVNYAHAKGIEVIGHHETGGDIETYEKLVKKAFKMYRKLGIQAVKTGYAGPISSGEHHHGQFMVRHCNKIMRLAAHYKIMLDVHEPVPFSGLSRTYPNLMTGEGMRGMEWNAWSEGNKPTHTCTLPFTRGIMGPMDYTPGIFGIDLSQHKAKRQKWNDLDKGETSVHSTLANQLALLVVFFSPLQMMADLPENYAGHPATFFFANFPGTWDETKVLDAAIGKYIVVARRSGSTWYVGGITNENERTIRLPLDFLDQNKSHHFKLIKDTEASHFELNPESYEISTGMIEAPQALIEIRLAPGGGFALMIDPPQH